MKFRLYISAVRDVWEYRLAAFLCTGALLSTAALLVMLAVQPCDQSEPDVSWQRLYGSGEVIPATSGTSLLRTSPVEAHGSDCHCNEIMESGIPAPVDGTLWRKTCCDQCRQRHADAAAPTSPGLSRRRPHSLPLGLAMVPLWGLMLLFVVETGSGSDNRQR